jgi:serine/threonine protein kinase/alpha-tubulin suppressor-like RCC1 family protein
MDYQRVAEARLGGDGDVAELSNEYELLSELGRGGSAVVYRALDRALGRDVAIKVVHPRAAAPGDDPVARLAREARTVAQLQHPNIVTVFAVRRLHSGGLALVMQLVPGSTLKQVIQRESPLAPDRVERLMRDVAGALSYAHARGVVHRDVKPENIFIEEGTGRALLADFGIARSDEHDSMTLTGTALGTPFYMSPEQVEGGTLDGRSDLYSLGLVAWEMLTGRRPWDGESLYNVIYKQKHEELPPIEALRAGVPLRLQYIVERMLQKRPAARWAGADGLLAQLAHAVLPSDYGKWQGTLKRRVDRFRDSERARARTASPTPERATSNAAPTLRFTRPRSSDDASPQRTVPGSGPLHQVRVDASTTTISTGWPPDGGALTDAATRSLALHSVPIDAPPPIEQTAPVRYDDVTAPTWAAGGSEALVTRRPVLLGLGGLLAVFAVVAGAAAGRPALLAKLGLAYRAPTSSVRALAATPDPTDSASLVAQRATASEAPVPATASFPIGPSADVLSVGAAHACLVSFGGSLHCWGDNSAGQLGDATDVGRLRPVRVLGEFAFVQVSAGTAHSCAVTTVGDAYCWGSDSRGQLGDGTTVRRTAPVRVAGSDRYRLVASGGAHSCGITSRSDVVCWGANDRAQLGDLSSAPFRSVPGPVRVGSGGAVTALATGLAHSCALASDGQAYCWGANDAGQLGDGTRTERAVPAAVAGPLRFRSLAAGAQHSCGVTVRGQVACWGRNQELELGSRGAGARAVTPVLVPLPSDFVAVLAAAGAGSSCALGERGDAWCWGRNHAGQLGTRARDGRALPARVVGPQSLATIAVASTHACALTTSGEPLCWGANRVGQLGDSTRVARPSPVRVRLAPQVVSLPLRAR